MKTKLSLLICLLTVLVFSSLAQTVTTHTDENDAKKAAGQGITFKIPDGYMPMKEWSGFKGVLMLNAKQPAGIFISYPDKGEKIDDLIARVVKYVPPMFVHDEKTAGALKWNISDIPVHDGDKTASGKMYIATNDTDTVQISFYQREWNDLTLIYGYFSLKGKKVDNDVWADDKGQGIKGFEKFWKTFPVPSK